MVHEAKEADLKKRHDQAERERTHNLLRNDKDAVNALLPSARTAAHGDNTINVDREKELKDVDEEWKKKMGIKQNLGHSYVHRKKDIWYNQYDRPGEGLDDDDEKRLRNKRLREDPLASIPREFRNTGLKKSSSSAVKGEARSSDDCVIVDSKKKKKKSKKEKKKKKKKHKKSYSSDSDSSDDGTANRAKMAELRKQRLAREAKARRHAEELRSRSKGLFQ